MREESNLREVLELKPQFIGFIHHSASPRHVSEEQLRTLLPMVPNDIDKVLVTVDLPVKELLRLLTEFPFEYVQLHGNETEDYADTLPSHVRTIKVVSVSDLRDIEVANRTTWPDMLLFDTKGKLAGGNGVHFVWNLMASYIGKVPFMLSGGIGPKDIYEINDLNFPEMTGVDINSQFETEPGKKDVALLKTFKQALL